MEIGDIIFYAFAGLCGLFFLSAIIYGVFNEPDDWRDGIKDLL